MGGVPKPLSTTYVAAPRAPFATIITGVYGVPAVPLASELGENVKDGQ
jgi:hypothetical protein